MPRVISSFQNTATEQITGNARSFVNGIWNISSSDEIQVRQIDVKMKKKILIVDDHDIFREALKNYINGMKDIIITAEATNPKDACHLASAADFDLVLLDIGFQARTGFSIIHDIKNKKPYLPVLICSLLPEEYFGPAAIRAGASGYIMKDTTPNEIANAIRQVIQGGVYFGNGRH
jgi:two-component system, NarL family, invasion response regulator UvrY